MLTLGWEGFGYGKTDLASDPGLARQFTPPLGQQLSVTSSDHHGESVLGFQPLHKDLRSNCARAEWYSVDNFSRAAQPARFWTHAVRGVSDVQSAFRPRWPA